MTKSISGPRAIRRRRGSAFALVVLMLLNLSCEKKAAPPPSQPDNFSKPKLTAGLTGAAFNYSYSANAAPASPSEPDTFDTRKIIRNGSLELLVNDVAQSVARISAIVSGVGGFVEKTTQTNSA